MENVVEELGIPKKFVKTTQKPDRFSVNVPKSWLKSLVKHSKLIEFNLNISDDESVKQATSELILVRVFKKLNAKVLPLPKIRKNCTESDSSPLFLAQLLQYISQSNHKNLAKEAQRKYLKNDKSKERQINVIEYNEALKEIILRTYGCPFVNICDTNDDSSKNTFSEDFEVHLNVLPSVCCVETLNSFILLHIPWIEYTLQDCVNFSPAILEKCYTKPLFVIYQLLKAFCSFHDRSLTVGDITLSDIYLTENLWIYILPQLTQNLHIQKTVVNSTKDEAGGQRFKTYDRVQVSISENLEKLCQFWINGDISNFTYLTALNNLSGRRVGDPNCHHVFPWVTDFASPCGKNWRDLKKSKYRLNKGDRQLDLTYESSKKSHHVSDVLSSITYYVYTARRTSKTILCKNVRTVWVPAEYPSSIQRMQEWTPDECIPEFFTDPGIFRSIHDDLDDLEVPSWCSSPESFIEKHRDALESQHVSERLHHWIDLTFGFKLSGNAAIKSKNVCLHLADDHTNLTKSGIVQLFNHPHPPRFNPAQMYQTVPNKFGIAVQQKNTKPRNRDRSNSSINVHELHRNEDDETNDEELLATVNVKSSLSFTRFLSQSRSSLHDENDFRTTSKSPSRSSSVGPKSSTFTSHVISTTPKNSKQIILPKDFRPEFALELLEKKHSFFSKTFHSECGKSLVLPNNPNLNNEPDSSTSNIQNSFTNFMYSENFKFDRFLNKQRQTKKEEDHVLCNYAEFITKSRVRELQILGCLILEIFTSKKMQILSINRTNLSFDERLKSSISVLRTCEIPNCIKNVVGLLLQPELKDFTDVSYPPVSKFGLPTPSPHLLLEPLIHFNVKFSKHFANLYKLLGVFTEFKNISAEMNVIYHFECNGLKCSEYEAFERTKISLVKNIAECQVKTAAKLIENIFETLNATSDTEIVEIMLPHVKDLIEEPPTSVLASWYLFDAFSRVLGPRKTSEVLLESLLKLYENEPSESTLIYYGRIAKLYHHSFLLRLMVRIGLRNFLDNFIAPIVEAVGGYRDYETLDFIFHSHKERASKKIAHLKTMDSEQSALENSPNSDNSSPSSKEPEMFEFDEEKNVKTLIEEFGGCDELPLNHSTAEEALDATLTLNIEVSPTETAAAGNCENISSESSFESKKLSKHETTKSSDVSCDSLIWLSHRLGPVLTARYLSRNLLKMLTLCYVGNENLKKLDERDFSNEIISITSSYVLGDKNASKVLECLGNIAGLYGEQFILVQYIPHMSDLIALCKRKITQNLEGSLISCLALLKYVIPYLSDSTLMDQLQDNILRNVIHPSVRLLGSTKCSFPNGSMARRVFAKKYIDAMYVLSIRIGSDMTRTHLAVPALQRFFLIFDKVHANENYNFQHQHCDSSSCSNVEDSNIVELNRDGSSREWSISEARPIQIKHVRLKDEESTDSTSPPISTLDTPKEHTAFEELQAVFTPKLAYVSFMPFLRYLGDDSLEISLKNIDTIKDLCKEYTNTSPNKIPSATSKTPSLVHSGSIGSNVSVIGNRIEMQYDAGDNCCDLLNLVSNKIENNNRHLRGNWLAYWGHEIGRPEKDVMFNFKQIKLQSFQGHTHGVKCLHVLDNENSFMSGSRDKTVKLWSLRSQGDGSSISNCQWTYTAHKKSVLSITFIESMRLVASCDSVIHIWDPFMGVNVALLEAPKYAPVNTLKSMPAPSSLIYAATTDGTLKIIDSRLCSYIYELKVSVNLPSLIRCLVAAPSGLWIAAGQSSGNIVVLDTRTGLIISSWRAHEAEVLQLVAVDNNTLISSSLDQNISVWNVSDGKFKFHMRGSTEPVHCLNVYNTELLSGSTANRIGVHTAIEADASFSSTKLRSDAFKGLLTSMVNLPLNRLLLLGADTGNITLLC